jgi:hypothetical protein
VAVAVSPTFAVYTTKADVGLTPFHAKWQREMSEHASYERLGTRHTITATVDFAT